MISSGVFGFHSNNLKNKAYECRLIVKDYKNGQCDDNKNNPTRFFYVMISRWVQFKFNITPLIN